ncbi:MAG: UDP-N-acetylmuramate dehydrogenase [Steroidobacteraceae bacterium]
MTLPIAVEFASRVRYDEPMSRHTTWHVGGPADVFFQPRDRADLLAFCKQLPSTTPIHWLGLGSNLLVRDAGIRGVVIAAHAALATIERRGANAVYAESGVPCALIARRCIDWQLGPADFFAGIPGTLGGALAMNAGAFGGETWPHVRIVEVIDRHGNERERAASEYTFGYRHIVAPASDEWFLAAQFEFQPLPANDRQPMLAMLARRKASQPIGEWSCGSTFTNPAGDHAARLIEAAGLKGYRIGGAMVSRKHANFLINTGTATAADIEQLVAHIQSTVLARQGVRLTPEFRIAGEAS